MKSWWGEKYNFFIRGPTGDSSTVNSIQFKQVLWEEVAEEIATVDLYANHEWCNICDVSKKR